MVASQKEKGEGVYFEVSLKATPTPLLHAQASSALVAVPMQYPSLVPRARERRETAW